MRDANISTIRTVVPAAQATLIAEIIDDRLITLTDNEQVLVTLVVLLVWHRVVRALEEWQPNFGWVLGKAEQPIYQKGT